MQYSQEGEFLSSNVTSQICNFFIFGVMVVTQKSFEGKFLLVLRAAKTLLLEKP